jgi:hypothetical protein
MEPVLEEFDTLGWEEAAQDMKPLNLVLFGGRKYLYIFWVRFGIISAEKMRLDEGVKWERICRGRETKNLEAEERRAHACLTPTSLI